MPFSASPAALLDLPSRREKEKDVKIQVRKNGLRSNREQFRSNVYMLKMSIVKAMNSIFHTLCFGLLRGIVQIVPNEDKFHRSQSKQCQ